jgi:hypothetical protein
MVWPPGWRSETLSATIRKIRSCQPLWSNPPRSIRDTPVIAWKSAPRASTSAECIRWNRFRRGIKRINRKETKRRGTGSITYLFTLDDYWTLDGALGGSGAEIINHSCDPNLYAWIFKGHILYMSKRAIEAGEELTVDYRFSEKIDKVRCRCGSPHCRGTINLK